MKGRRQIGVMLSSTFTDLEEKRKQVIETMRRHDMFDVAMESDAALPTLDKIASSLRKVEIAEAYVCVIGYRYGSRETCAIRNPENLSLTELEWRHARDRGIPRCTLIMSPNYAVPIAEVEAVSAEDRESLAAFRKLAEADMVHASFDDPAGFEVKVMQSLEQLRHDLDLLGSTADSAAGSATPLSAENRLPIAPPGFHFVRKPYVEKRHFVGRVNELAQIDSWAASNDSMLLFQGIGGMGKSMLTWHWVKHHSGRVRDDWAGRLWYSFYEQGADLNDFCVHALAYIRHVPPAAFRGLSTTDLGEELRRELDARPWLLILDGLERVLVAYNRSGKEHMTDEDAEVMQDALGLDREPRRCFRPEDDEVLAALAQVDRGKLLASSRLMPTALTSGPREPIPGVTPIALEGFAPADAEAMLRKANIRGDGWRMQRYLKEQFACHPLTVGVVAGMVNDFLEARGDFDKWVDDPHGGADPAMLAKDLRGRQNHILARAFDGLDDDEKNLLGAIAMANIDLPMEIVRIINPKRPFPPEPVDAPGRRTEQDLYYKTDDPDINAAYWAWTSAESPEQRASAQETLDAMIDADLDEQTRAYEAYLAEVQRTAEAAKVADEWLLRALRRFEARDLLQFHPSTGAIDMHPAIRHTAINGLSPEARTSTGSHVSDALSSRPQQPYESARASGDIALAIACVKALVVADKFEAAFEYLGQIQDVLMRLEREDILVELIQPFFPEGWDGTPVEVDEDKAEVLYIAKRALRWSSPFRRRMAERELRLNLESRHAVSVCLSLCEFYLTSDDGPFHVRRFRLVELADRLADALADKVLKHRSLLKLAECHLAGGNLADAHSCLQPCRVALNASDLVNGLTGYFLGLEIEWNRRSETLTRAMVDAALDDVRAIGDVSGERIVLREWANWLSDHAQYPQALTAYGDLIALANSTSARTVVPTYRAMRVRSLVGLSRLDEARAAAADYSKESAPDWLTARNFLLLGDNDKAREHALAAFKYCWGDGPPHHYHWALEECRRILAAVGAAEPVLASVDPATVEPFDFEADIERLIDKEVAKRAGRDPGAKP